MKVFRDGILGEPILIGECSLQLPEDQFPETVLTSRDYNRPIAPFVAPLFAVNRTVDEWRIGLVSFRGGQWEKVIRLRFGDDPTKLPGFSPT